MTGMYPWHRPLWQRMAQSVCDRKAQSLLLAGPSGMGKRTFALQLVKLGLCQNPLQQDTDSDRLILPCGACVVCKLLKRGTFHPDWLDIRAEAGKQISIDCIRALNEPFQLTPTQSWRRVISILPVDALHRSAAHAFLKTLEELPPYALVILVSDAPQFLLPTLQSRCQLVRFRPTWDQASTQWLAQALSKQGMPTKEADRQAPRLLHLADGAPLRALVDAKGSGEELDRWLETWLSDPPQDPFASALQYKAVDLILFINYWQVLVLDLMQMLQWGQGARLRLSHPKLEAWCVRPSRLDQVKLVAFYDALLRVKAEKQAGIPLNVQLMLEHLFLLWVGLSH